MSSSTSAAVFHSQASQALGCQQVARLFSPLACRTFTDVYFERLHLLSRATGMEHLLRSEELPGLASHWQFKIAEDHAQARILLPDSFMHDDAYKPGALLDGPALTRAVQANRTVVLHNVELYSRRIGLLALGLMRAFGVYSQANVYYSPPGLESAVHAHQDAQSVFIVQCEGRKRWQLLEPPQRWRLRYNQRGKAGDVAPEEELTRPLADITLAPGDVLFVPRGLYHRTSTLIDASGGGGIDAGSAAVASLHVTIGVETDTDGWTWLVLLKDAAAALGLDTASAKLDAAQWRDERLREALPLRLCRSSRDAFESASPLSAGWLARARQLLAEHADATPDAERLKRALDDALRPRREHVEKKRQQVLTFLAMNEVQSL